VDEEELLKLAHLSKVNGERNTEHGKTLVQIIDFKEESERKKIIRMLADHYTGILWKLLPYLRRLGNHSRAQIRRRIAETVGELMIEDFIRVKDEVLMPWAMHWSPVINANVGLVLAIVAEDPRYTGNVKSLINHWITVPNSDLNWTALASCVPFCSLWPEEILSHIEKSLRRGRMELLALSIFVIRELCHTGHTDKAIKQISNWIHRKKDEQSLRTGAGIIFLEAVRFTDLVARKTLLPVAVEIFVTSLEDSSLDSEGIYRSLVLEKLHTWIQAAVDDKKSASMAEKLFLELYDKSNQRGRERLEFNLSRWLRTSEGKETEIYQRLLTTIQS
jgi:hypothetical protein